MADIDVDVLDHVLAKTGTLIDETAPDAGDRPTPCPELDVAALTSHIVGWIQQFAAAVNDRDSGIDPTTYRAGDDAVEVFRTAADDAVAGWRAGAAERDVAFYQSEIPGRMAFAMMLAEYVVHGWDLAVATDRPVPFTEEEAELALALLEPVLQPQYRGETFAPPVAIDAGASAVDRLVAFTGRQPRTGRPQTV